MVRVLRFIGRDLGPISKMKLVGILTLIYCHVRFHQQF